MTSVVVCGIAGYFPLAGVALHYLQYCLGFRDLGVEVSYLEDNQAWPLHPDTRDPDGTAAYTVAWLTELFGRFELPWAYRDPSGDWHGATGAEVHARCARADLLLNVSGGSTLGEHHRRAGLVAYVDTDPAFTQVAAEQHKGVRDWIARHDLHFTFAELYGRPECRLPSGGFRWITTRQPVWLPFWNHTRDRPGTDYTTVMHWAPYGVAHWDGEEWGQKNAEFPLVLDLPGRTGASFEVGLDASVDGNAPVEEIRQAGWRVVDPRVPTRTIWSFRDYIAASRGEVTVAKQGYVRSRSGWFSERGANYLAAGRPVIAQDTGWGEHDLLPTGQGLFPFSTTEEAAAAVEAVNADADKHAQAARSLAAREFDASKVLARMLSDAGVD
ncbi:MAG TPA: hypothetical protein VGF64_09560 [Acidimicrobiales bacterium]